MWWSMCWRRVIVRVGVGVCIGKKKETVSMARNHRT
jgi:hypothetical protein